MPQLLDGDRTSARAASLLVILAWFGGCTTDVSSTDRRINELLVPSRFSFARVADGMQVHCGTLDCHGQVGRNMRLYGHHGLRLASTDNPFDPQTTFDEYSASYASVVGLEPEIMSLVVEKQINPESLAMVRKPRGIEQHKGGQLMVENDTLDRCVVGWITGDFQVDACSTVADDRRPEVDGGSGP
jgi:hypothetical protein